MFINLIGDENTKVQCSDKQENLIDDFAFYGCESGSFFQFLLRLAV
jgi:hypothetical protein